MEESFHFFSLIYDPASDLSATKYSVSTLPFTIENDYERWELLSALGEGEGVLFIVTKKEYDEEMMFKFDIRYWPSFG